MGKKEEAPKFTLRQAKEILNQVPEELLDRPMYWWGEEEGGDCKLIVLEEAYVNPTGDGYEAISEYEKEGEDMSDEPSLLPKGMVIVDLFSKPLGNYDS